MIYTIGHSNLSSKEFVGTLLVKKIEILVDVRAYPNSKLHPQFNQEDLRFLLNSKKIQYNWAGRQLGGKRKSLKSSRHTAIESEGFRAYADHMESSLFQNSAKQLISLSTKGNLAVMCAEKSPDQCHRFYLSDYLLLNGAEVTHILSVEETKQHLLNPTARRESAELIYDRMATGQLNF